MDRPALMAERAELQRKYIKRRGVAGYGANSEAILARMNDIDAMLAVPLPPIASLAGQVLGDEASPPKARSLAARVLNGAAD